MKVVVNSRYANLEEFVRRIPQGDNEPGRTLHDSRNKIELLTADGGVGLVVKRFKCPPLLNRVFYTLGRTKARRSYENGMRLLENGVDTPEPVAYIEIKRDGLFHTGYYICRFAQDELLDIIERYPEDQRKDIIRHFAAFTVELHKKGIIHRDYNPRNIFFHKEGEGYRFSLVDINRMRFGRLSRHRVVKELTRLNFSLPTLVAIAEQYALARGWDPEKLCARLMLERSLNLYWRMKKYLRPVKRFLGIK